MSEGKLLETVEIDVPAPTASVIWLHGLGADGHDFEALVPQLDLPAEANVRFVFPHAPYRPVTINGGQVMRAWYDVLSMSFGEAQDEQGIRQSARQIEMLIERETGRGIPAGRIILAGFSQGGAIALHTGLRFAPQLGGILALSTYLPLADSVTGEMPDANRTLSVMMMHGSEDPVIPLALGERSRRHLEALGIDIDLRTYPMAHALCAEQVRDIRAWLLDRIVTV